MKLVFHSENEETIWMAILPAFEWTLWRRNNLIQTTAPDKKEYPQNIFISPQKT